MLKDYEKKRDFSLTREPKSSRRGREKGGLRFVVQKHAARRLHYDFRLELDGVLKSWAVPKGPSVDTRQKRLAVMVEDHPLDYATYEGVISHGNYGGGQVIVWDTGTYSPDEDGRLSFGNRAEAEARMRQDLEKGKLSITLRGRKLRGSWTLVRTARSPSDWLLIKHRDEHADPGGDVLGDERSVQSGLTIADLKDGRLPDPVLNESGSPESEMETLRARGKITEFPSRLAPMLTRMANKPFSHSDWLYEPKLDGYRVMAFLQRGKVSLLSRNGLDLTSRLPMVARELEAQSEEELVLDGEIVALNEHGLPDFGLLQQSMNLERSKIDRMPSTATIVYYPFDLLYLRGTSLQQVPLYDRKTLLAEVLTEGAHLQRVEYVEATGESFFQAAVALGLEGMVAKRRDSIYEPGARSRSWLKVKAIQDQEFVVGGYTPGTGARSATFGALLLGYYEGPKLHYAGRVGSGFTQSTLEGLLESLSGLQVERSPFVHDPELNDTDNRWVRPEMVVGVKFSQWTEDGRLRAPVFIGIRPDLDPGSVVRETHKVAVSLKESDPQTQPESLDNEVAAALE